MTLLNELEKRAEYKKIQFVEFLEFICRVADCKFRNSEYEDEVLSKKIEMVLDMMFELIGAKRKDVNIEEQFLSESSDGEYNINYLQFFKEDNKNND